MTHFWTGRYVARMSRTPSAHDGKRTSLLSAVAQIGLAAVVLAGVIGWLSLRGEREEAIAHHVERAQVLARPDNPRDLTAALAELDAALALDPRSAQAHALAADLEAERALDLGLADARARAAAHLEVAEAEQSNAEERYAAEALLAIAEGRAAEVEPRIEALIRSGAHSSRFWEVLGRAHVAMGQTGRGYQELGRALSELGPSPRLLTAIGEAALADMQFDAAQDAFKQVLATYPTHLRARVDLTLARFYVRDGMAEAWKDQAALAQREPELEGVLHPRMLAAKAELQLAQEHLAEALPLATEAAAQGHGDLFTEATLARASEAAGSPLTPNPELAQWSQALWLAQTRSAAEGRTGRWAEAATRVARFEQAPVEHAHERAELLRQVALNGMLAARNTAAEATPAKGATRPVSYVAPKVVESEATMPVCILLAESARTQLAQKPEVAAELYRQAIRAGKAVGTPAGDMAKLREQVEIDLKKAGHPELASLAHEP